MESQDIAPVIIMGILFLIPIVKILVNHQQKMTEMTYRLNQQNMQPPLEHHQLHQDVQDMKQLVQQQAIAIDNLSNKLDRLTPQSVQDRISESA